MEEGIKNIIAGLNQAITGGENITVLEEFDRVLGLELLRAIHFNDSSMPFGSHKDRHSTIGTGMIGLDALISFMKHPAVRELSFYTETPLDDEGHKAEIRMIKEKIGEAACGE